MRILAVDTSQIQSCLALVEDAKIARAASGSTSVAHSQGLLPLIDQQLKAAHWDIETIDSFAAGVGPGSFTGIRIGCATVKAFAQVLGREVIAFSSLKALALSCDSDLSSVVAMVNAYQGQFFIGWQNPKTKTWVEDAASPLEWMNKNWDLLVQKHSKISFCGTGAFLAFDQIKREGAELSSIQHINAEGIVRAMAGEAPCSYLKLSANYLRPSQAEAKLEALR